MTKTEKRENNYLDYGHTSPAGSNIYKPVLIRNGKRVLFLKAMKTLVKQQERDIKKKQQRERERERESERTMKM